jgi:hypothetical protein
MEVSTPTIEFSEAERRAFAKRQRKMQALLAQMADASPEEQRRLDDKFMRDVRAENRIAAVRYTKSRPSPARAPRRSNGPGGKPRAQATRSSARSGDGPDADPGDPDWHWRQPNGWLNLVRSVWTYDVEREIARERDCGWSR